MVTRDEVLPQTQNHKTKVGQAETKVGQAEGLSGQVKESFGQPAPPAEMEHEDGQEGEEPAEGEGQDTGSSEKKKKKKKKKKSQQNPTGDTTAQGLPPTSGGAPSARPASTPASAPAPGRQKKGGAGSPLPSQHLVESHFKWKAVLKPRKGRCAVASQALKAGDVVVAEAAVAFVVRHGGRFSASVCHGCCGMLPPVGVLRNGQRTFSAPQPCPTCSFAVYCQECQGSEPLMAAHRAWCPLLAAVPRIARAADCSLDLLRLILHLARARCLPSPYHPSSHASVPSSNPSSNPSAHSSSDPAPAPAPAPGLAPTKEKGPLLSLASLKGALGHGLQEPREGVGFVDPSTGVLHSSFHDVMHLSSSLQSAAPDWRASIRQACQALLAEAQAQADAAAGAGAGAAGEGARARKALEALGTIEDLEAWAAILNNNVHGMGMGGHGGLNTDVALGLFPFVSLLNHSCRPNCIFVSSGTTMYVRALQDIPAGTELCLSYINLYEPRHVRQQQLLQSKHFQCLCERCSEPMPQSLDRFLEGVVCHRKGCTGVLYRDVGPSAAAVDAGGGEERWACDTCHRVVTAAADPASLGGAAGGKGVQGTGEGEQTVGGGRGGEAETDGGYKDDAEGVGTHGMEGARERDGKGGAKGGKGAGKGAKAKARAGPGSGAGARGGERGGERGDGLSGEVGKGGLLPWEVEAAARAVLEEAMEQYRSDQGQTLVKLLAFQAEFGSKLHPLHSLLFDSRTPLMNCARAVGHVGEAVKQAQAIVEALGTVTPWEVVEQANFLEHLGELLGAQALGTGVAPNSALARRAKKQAKEAQEKAEAMRKLCRPPNNTK